MKFIQLDENTWVRMKEVAAIKRSDSHEKLTHVLFRNGREIEVWLPFEEVEAIVFGVSD